MFLSNCHKCQNLVEFQQQLETLYDNLLIDQMTNKTWMNVDYMNLETTTRSNQEFIEHLLEKLKSFETP